MSVAELRKRSTARWALLRRMILRRADGVAYLDRIRLVQTPWLAIYLHRFDAPDPGYDLHDHPWPFITMVLTGGYLEARADARDALRGRRVYRYEHRRRFRPRRMRLTECHTITTLDKVGTRSIVLVGRRSRDWGFYTPEGWVPHTEYDERRRHLIWQEG